MKKIALKGMAVVVLQGTGGPSAGSRPRSFAVDRSRSAAAPVAGTVLAKDSPDASGDHGGFDPGFAATLRNPLPVCLAKASVFIVHRPS